MTSSATKKKSTPKKTGKLSASKPPFFVADKPCSSCPYRRDVPAGIWDTSEYDKLRDYDPQVQKFPNGMEALVPGPALAPFLCHQLPKIEQETLCAGWLAVHCDSVPVRLLLLVGRVTPEQVFAEPKVPLYATGNEAADAGIAGVERPSAAARELSEKIVRQRLDKGRRARIREISAQQKRVRRAR